MYKYQCNVCLENIKESDKVPAYCENCGSEYTGWKNLETGKEEIAIRPKPTKKIFSKAKAKVKKHKPSPPKIAKTYSPPKYVPSSKYVPPPKYIPPPHSPPSKSHSWKYFLIELKFASQTIVGTFKKDIIFFPLVVSVVIFLILIFTLPSLLNTRVLLLIIIISILLTFISIFINEIFHRGIKFSGGYYVYFGMTLQILIFLIIISIPVNFIKSIVPDSPKPEIITTKSESNNELSQFVPFEEKDLNSGILDFIKRTIGYDIPHYCKIQVKSVLNVRNSPNVSDKKIGFVKNDEIYKIILEDETKDWYLIEDKNGNKGWINKGRTYGKNFIIEIK